MESTDWAAFESAFRTYRLKAPGGWLVRYDSPGHASALVFVPDPTWAWNLEPRTWEAALMADK